MVIGLKDVGFLLVGLPVVGPCDVGPHVVGFLLVGPHVVGLHVVGLLLVGVCDGASVLGDVVGLLVIG